MSILTLFSTFPLGNEEFGFNGNILETNIINLSVVIGVVVNFGGDALRSLLDTRKATILKNFEEAKLRSDEARERLKVASEGLDTAKIKATVLADQVIASVEKERINSAKQLEFDTNRLEQSKRETLRSQEQKIKLRVAKKLVALAIERAEEKIKSRLTPRLHDSVNNFNIVLLRNM